MHRSLDRRRFLETAGLAIGGLALATSTSAAGEEKKPLFKISLAEWSLHRALFAGKMKNLDFPKPAKNDYGIEAVEYVNQFFKDKAKDQAYLRNEATGRRPGREQRADHDRQRRPLGDPDEAKRTKAVENHYQWVEAAKFLGCHSIRVNAYSEGSPEEQAKLAADGLRRVAEFGAISRHQRDRREPRRPVVERRVAGVGHQIRQSTQLRHVA